MNTKKILAICLIVIALLSIVFGVLSFIKSADNNRSYYTRKETYGGDAYTGIQNAGANGANNTSYVEDAVHDMHDAVMFGFGAVLIIAGLFIGVLGVSKLLKKSDAPAAKTLEPFQPVRENVGTAIPPRREESESSDDSGEPFGDL